MWTYKDNELYHYGVLGMKWGVRKAPESSGRSRNIKIIGGKKNGQRQKSIVDRPNRFYDGKTLTKVGKKKYKTTDNYKRNYGYDRAKKALLIAAGVGTAAIVGTHIYRHGLTFGDSVLKAGTLVQNLSYKGNDGSVSFYGVHNKRDMRAYFHQFHEGHDVATIFKSDRDLKIAGRRAMDKALKDAVKLDRVRMSNMTEKRIVGPKNLANVPIKTFSQRTQFWREYGANDEEIREKIHKQLRRRGYSGFKDVNDMLIDWGDTPTVWFSNSGLKVVKQSKINHEKAQKLKNRVGVGRKIVTASGLVGYTTGLTGYQYLNAKQTNNNSSYRMYNKPYKKLSRSQKTTVKGYSTLSEVSKKRADNLSKKYGGYENIPLTELYAPIKK